MFVNRNYVHWAKVTQQLKLLLILPACRQLLLLDYVFVTRDFFCLENLFLNRFVRDAWCSWTEVPRYITAATNVRCSEYPQTAVTSHDQCNHKSLFTVKLSNSKLIETSVPDFAHRPCFIKHSVSYCQSVSITRWTIVLVLEMTNNVHRFAPLLYSIYWLLHVLAVVCHQGASGSVWVTWKYRSVWWYII
jgi:hypothetical protein